MKEYEKYFLVLKDNLVIIGPEFWCMKIWRKHFWHRQIVDMLNRDEFIGWQLSKGLPDLNTFEFDKIS